METSPNSRQLRTDTAKNTNPDPRRAEADRREIERRHTFTYHGSDENLELPNEKRYGRLHINTDMCPCVKRACLSLEAIHLSIIGKMQIKGKEQKKLIEAIEKAPGKEKVELYHGKIETP